MDTNEGPAPRKNFQPVEKRPTGADQFYNDHQAQYEQLAMDQKNTIEQVKQHNNTCPKLRDELKKRDSIIRVTTIKTSRFCNTYDPTCTACAKMLTLKELTREKVRPKCKISKPRRPHKKSRFVQKKEPKHSKRKNTLNNQHPINVRFSSLLQNKSIQCVTLERELKSKMSVLCSVQASKIFKGINNEKKSLEHLKPEPDPSISSYNSFLSMEHEPMLNKGN